MLLKVTEGSQKTRIDFTVGVDESIANVVDALVGSSFLYFFPLSYLRAHLHICICIYNRCDRVCYHPRRYHQTSQHLA